eukprot:9891485-Alexandrium_andersonii.AAC.1
MLDAFRRRCAMAHCFQRRCSRRSWPSPLKRLMPRSFDSVISMIGVHSAAPTRSYQCPPGHTCRPAHQ